MGRSTTPTFIVKFRCESGSHLTPHHWGKGDGARPNTAALERWVRRFEESTGVFGCNYHLGTQRVVSAEVIRQSTGQVVASYAQPGRPLFEVL